MPTTIDNIFSICQLIVDFIAANSSSVFRTMISFILFYASCFYSLYISAFNYVRKIIFRIWNFEGMPCNGGFVNIECLTMALIRRLVGVDSHVNRDMLTIFSIVVCFNALQHTFIHSYNERYNNNMINGSIHAIQVLLKICKRLHLCCA